MRFAYDNDGHKIEPSFSGQKGKCPLCKGTLIGKCGEIYAWHWQHLHDTNCDPWKEHETEWHRNWKAKFPSDWQEVIIEKEGEKHIADIRTPDGIIIEFQNSSISTSTITIREDFYRNMIWVVNAKEFKDNFKIRSVVKSLLRDVEQSVYSELKWLEDSYAKDIKSIENDIEKNEKEKISIFQNIKYNTEKIEKLNEVLNKHKGFTNTVIEKWVNKEWFLDSLTYDITYKINTEHKTQLQNISEQIFKLQKDIKLAEKNLEDITNLENFQIENKIFKIVKYEQIPSASFLRVRAISKLSRTSLFSQITEFKTETEFKSFQYSKNQFDFAVDPSNDVSSYNQKIEQNIKSIENLQNQLTLTKQLLANELVQELKILIQMIEEELVKQNKCLKDLEKENALLVEKKATKITMRDVKIRESQIEIEKDRDNRRLKIMREKKGLYRFDWKHKRKSWQVANNTIYFDFGEAYLFEVVKDGLFKKIEEKDFLKKYLAGYKNWNQNKN